MTGPASLALLTIGLYLGLADLKMGPALLSFVPKVLRLLYIIAVFWYAYNLVDVIDVVMRRFSRNGDGKLDQLVVLLVSRSLRVFLIVVGTLTVAESVFKQDIGAWLAGLGIAGLAVSLAAQDSIKHLFGSVAILLDRSFRIGDRVISGAYDGTIEDIGFRSTKLRTAAGHLVTIPNSSMVNSPIENVSRRPAIRRVVTLLISGRTPCDKVRQLTSALLAVFDEEGIRGPVRPRIDGVERLPQVRLEDIQAGDFKLTVTYWYAPATDPNHAVHAEKVNLRIIEALQKAGIELAQPLANRA
jgi:MscS family membrane protein